MYSTEALEQACADAWQPVIEDKIGDWRLRAATDPAPEEPGRRVRFTGRANSVLAVGDPGMPVERALPLVCDFAHNQGLPPLAQAVVGSQIETELADNGWNLNNGQAPGGAVSVQTCPFDRTQPTNAAIRAVPTPGWWELAVGSTEPTPAQHHVITSGDVGYGEVAVDGVTAGTLRAALVGDLVFVGTLAVRDSYRRMGMASDLMAAAGAWGRARGATNCVLQVAVGNTGALALYARLGFTEQHRYRYWRAP